MAAAPRYNGKTFAFTTIPDPVPVGRRAPNSTMSTPKEHSVVEPFIGMSAFKLVRDCRERDSPRIQRS